MCTSSEVSKVMLHRTGLLESGRGRFIISWQGPDA